MAYSGPWTGMAESEKRERMGAQTTWGAELEMWRGGTDCGLYQILSPELSLLTIQLGIQSHYLSSSGSANPVPPMTPARFLGST